MRRFTIPALLAAAAIVPAGVAHAQADSDSESNQPYECQTLSTYADGNQVANSELTSDQILLISEYNDVQTCMDALQVVTAESSMVVGSETYDETVHNRIEAALGDLDGVAGIETGQQASADAGGDAIDQRKFSVMGVDSASAMSGEPGEAMLVEEIIGLKVIGADGEDIGEVEEIVHRGDSDYLIVGAGGFLGIGESDVAFALSDVIFDTDSVKLRQFTEDDVARMQEVDADDFMMYQSGDQIEVRVQ